MKYRITDHCLNRFRERYSKQYKLRNRATKDEVFNVVIQLVENGKVDRSFINDTARMTLLYEKYGFERKYHIVQSADRNVVFIGVITGKNCRVLTCVDKFGRVGA